MPICVAVAPRLDCPMWKLTGPIQHISAYHAELTRIRRDLHAHPELGFEEYRTARLVAEQLRRHGVDEVHTGIGRTGVVGVIRGALQPPGEASPGAERAVRTVALRADMDALPMREESE